jgi:hypothetical protein
MRYSIQLMKAVEGCDHHHHMKRRLRCSSNLCNPNLDFQTGLDSIKFLEKSNHR